MSAGRGSTSPRGSDERTGRTIELFQRALDIAPAERGGWLWAACAGDDALRSDVEELLAEHGDGGDGDRGDGGGGEAGVGSGDPAELDSSASALRELADQLWVAPLPHGSRIGRYRLRRVLASGGMGTVYVAEQDVPHRTVALKLLGAGIESGAAQRRFEYESQILAHLHHPGIAQVYECGTVERGGRCIPWFAMEYVEDAQPITRFAAARGLDLDDRLGLFAQVCDAVHHGHQRGIVHRDLKPANILVDSQGRIKVIDFGVAKATDADLGLMTLQTRVGQLVGTLGYMSPEQMLGDSAAIDTRSDVYSLGVVLYELLTDRLPFDLDGSSIMASVRIVNEQEPDAALLLARGLPRDVRTIVLEALRKDRDERYGSAAALADDIERYRRSEPIAARPPSAWYQLGRFANRNRLLVGGALGLCAVLVLGSAGTLVGFLRAADARDVAERAHQEAEWGRDFLIQMLYDADPWHAVGPQVTLAEALQRASSRLDDNLPESPVEARMRAVLGEVELRLGEFELAERHLRRAVELRTGLGLGDQEATLVMRGGLCSALTGLRRLDEAERLATALMADHARILGVDHPSMLRARKGLADVYQVQNRHEEARALYAEGLAQSARHGDPDPKLEATVENNLALALQHLGRYGEAGALLREVIAFRRAELGDQHPDTFSAMNNLAGVLFAQHDYGAAIDQLERALANQEAQLGPDHPDTLQTVGNLATALRNAGRAEEAEPLARRAFEGRRHRFGPDAPEALVSLSNLAVSVTALGHEEPDPARRDAHYDEAAALLRVCLERYDAGGRGATAERAKAEGSYANLLLLRDDAAGALEHYTRARRMGGELWGTERWEFWVFQAGEAAAMAGVGRRDEALALLERSRERLRALCGPDHPSVATAEKWLAEAERAAGR